MHTTAIGFFVGLARQHEGMDTYSSPLPWRYRGAAAVASLLELEAGTENSADNRSVAGHSSFAEGPEAC